jgi:8-oxo-dGTP pyrophosphatase MutT (NUDIX family)
MMERHLTATGFVVDGDRVLLHWHRKNCLWLPFGGHIEPNEDPVQTVLREIQEESGLHTELLVRPKAFGISNLPIVAPPELILLEPTTDGVHVHEHVDLIYFCRPVGGLDSLATDADPSIRWVTAGDLELNQPMAPFPGAEAAPIPDDVRALALAAIARQSEPTSEC